MEQISTKELYQKNDGTLKIIDIRPVEAYNGWKLKNENRGGHIINAKSLPYKWSTYIDWLDIVQSKDIKPHHEIVVYGYSQKESEEVASLFLRAGYHNVKIYPSFLSEWSSSTSLPMAHLKRYKHLVSAPWLKQLMETNHVPEYRNTKFVICHAHYQNRSAYDEGHIPGAVELDTNTLESPETWNRHSPQELKKTLENLGINYDTTVILYGRFSFPDNNDPFPGSSAGQLGAFRCAFIMMYAGVKDVRVLNGGLQAWIDEGYHLSTTETEKIPVKEFGASIPQHPEIVIDTPKAREYLKSPACNLVSVRSWNEYIGKVSGYSYIEKKGRIPGAVFGNCGSDAYHMENYRNLDHTTREYHELEEMWKSAGIIETKQNAFYCGTGWRGSEAFFNAWLLGWPRISVYDGGWFEWSTDENNPIETGIPENI